MNAEPNITVDPWLHKTGDATVPDDAELVCVYENDLVSPHPS